MSVKVSSWVWHEATSEVSGNELILLLALADVADDHGRCRFVDDESALTYDGLAEKVRVDRRTIERLIPKLRERGLVEQVKGVKGRPNEFAIAVPWAKKSTDNLSENDGGPVADSPTTVQDSPTTATTFTDNSDSRTSLKRIDVTTDVTTSTVVKPETVGQRFAQPLCDVLAVELQRNEVKFAVSKKWLADARLLIDSDGRDPHEARALIEWACRDSFWRSNILSMPAFRKQYDKLRLARERDTGSRGIVAGGQVAADILRQRRAVREQRSVAS